MTNVFSYLPPAFEVESATAAADALNEIEDRAKTVVSNNLYLVMFLEFHSPVPVTNHHIANLPFSRTGPQMRRRYFPKRDEFIPVSFPPLRPCCRIGPYHLHNLRGHGMGKTAPPLDCPAACPCSQRNFCVRRASPNIDKNAVRSPGQ